MTRYSQVVLDVDSTLSGIEGIDWLASRCGAEACAAIAAMTAAAMRGDVPLESVYSARLDIVRPTRADIAGLAKAYVAAIAPGARKAIALLRSNGLQVALVSGGLRDAILPLAAYVGIEARDVHAVPLCFTDAGEYDGYDSSSALWRSGGKPTVVASIASGSEMVAVGDGMTDADLKPVVAKFVAFTGFARNDRVVACADDVISSFVELPPLVLP